jgi:hypothetical protein
MNEQIDQNDDEDTQAHLYIPKDERASGAPDTEGHKRMRGRVEDAGEGDVVGHGRRTPGDPVNEPPAVRGREAQGRR